MSFLVDTNILLRTADPKQAMYAHGLTHILTFNNRDFARYAEVTAVHPQELRSPS